VVDVVVVFGCSLGCVVMADVNLAREAKRGTVSAAAVAERLCVVVFKNGKVDGRYAMSFDDLVTVSRFTVPELATGLAAGLKRDWFARDKARAVLKAAGIHIAKKALGRLA
jgi:hypothetical protein